MPYTFNTVPDKASGDVFTEAMWDDYIKSNVNNGPRGVVAYATKTNDQDGVGTSLTDITGLSVTFTAASSRLYRVTLCLQMIQRTGTGTTEAHIADSANNALALSTTSLEANYWGYTVITYYETGISGSVTRKARAKTNASTVDIKGTQAKQLSIAVEDMGAA